MKLFGRLWAAVVNFLLIILPVVLLSSLLYLYREPIAEQFRDFLGDPITEAENIVLQFDEQTPRAGRINELRSFFTQLQAREELSETERERLQSVIFNLHRSLVGNLGIELEEIEVDEVREAYLNLLTSALVERLFPRHHQVREELIKDWDRIVRVLNLPDHPTRGLSSYLEATEIVQRAINDYELIYSPRLDCQSLFQTDCSEPFKESVTLTASRVERYFRTLPAPTSSDAGNFPEYVQLLPRLIRSYATLNEVTAGSLAAPPWENFENLPEVHQVARERLAEGSRELYASLLNEFEPEVKDFADPLAGALEEELLALTDIERMIVDKSEAEELLVIEATEKLRETLSDKLSRLYHEVKLRNQYEPDFEAPNERIEALQEGLVRLPGGHSKFEAKEQLLSEINYIAEQLEALIGQQNYEGLREKLIELNEHQLADKNQGWGIMVAGFFEANRDLITSVDWQPAEDEPREPYLSLIETISETATELALDNFGETWVQETRLALETRRLQQLEEDILAIMDSPQFSELTAPLTAKLEELLALDDLPDQLADRPEELLIAAIYLEEIRSEESNIHQKFGESVDQQIEDHREKLKEIVKDIQATRTTFNPERLNELVGLFVEWQQQLPDSRIGDAALQRLTTDFENILAVYLRSFKHFVSHPEETDLEENRLIEAAQSLNSSLDKLATADILELHFEGESYKNLLELRKTINELRLVAAEITAGGLLRGDEQYRRFEELTTPKEFDPLPDDYDYRWELAQLPELHELIIEKASEIHEQTSGQWLRGWGGRLTGEDMLEQWKDFLKNLEETTTAEPLAGLLAETRKESEQLLEEWSN